MHPPCFLTRNKVRPPTMSTQAISNVICGICSFFIPGLGQLLQGRIIAALLHFVLAAVLWVFWMGWLVTVWSVYSAATHKP